MDYTNAPNHATHAPTGQALFQDDEAIPCVWSALDGNAIFWSLMEVLKAGSGTRMQFNKDDPNSYSQLLLAIKNLIADERPKVISGNLLAANLFISAGSLTMVNGQPITSSKTTLTNPSATRPMLITPRVIGVRFGASGATTLTANNMRGQVVRKNGTVVALSNAPSQNAANEAFDIVGAIGGGTSPFLLAPGASEELSLEYVAQTTGTIAVANNITLEAYASFFGITV